MSKHEQNRAEKKERLLQAAVEAFTETGFDNTTVSDVVRRAGMTPSTFYNYYRDKDALLAELIEKMGMAMLEGWAEARDDGDTLGDVVRSAAARLYGLLVSDAALATLLRRNLSLVRSQVDHPGLEPITTAIRADVEAAVEKGEFRSVDVAYAAGVVRASLLAVGLELIHRQSPDVDAAAEVAAAVAAAGLRA